MKKLIENLAVKFLLSRSGPLMQKGVSAAAAAAATYAATHVEGIENLLPAELLAAVLWTLIDAAITRFGGQVIGANAKTLQRIANSYSRGKLLRVDGYVGPATVAAIASELDAANEDATGQ